MGFSGHAIAVVKSNRALLKKSRGFKELRKEYVTYSGDTELEFKDLSEFEKKKIRDKIIAQCKKDKRQEVFIFATCLVLAIGIIYGIYWLLIS